MIVDKDIDKRKSLIWNVNGKFIEQSWSDLYEKIIDTHSGLDIVADDFIELLTYQPAPFRDSNNIRRMSFTKITLDAVQEKDIKLLSKILAVMMFEPWATNLEGAWFIYYLAEKSDLYGFDAKRAALIINELHKINDYTAKCLMETLEHFVIETQKGKERVSDLVKETGLLIKFL